MTIEIKLSGFLFLFILVLQIAMAVFGYILEPTAKHYESDAKLLKFKNNPKMFQVGFALALIEHFSVITLAIMLFFVISPYNIILGIILISSRVVEGSIQVYLEKDYWGLFKIAKKYSNTSGTEKDSLFESYCSILRTKSYRFSYAMIAWSVGTFAFSIALIIYGLAPLYIGWIGIIASISIGTFDVLKLIKPNSKIYESVSSIFGLVAIVFEILIGGWLLFFI